MSQPDQPPIDPLKALQPLPPAWQSPPVSDTSAQVPADRWSQWTASTESRRRTSAVLIAVVALTFLVWSAATTLSIPLILCISVLAAMALAKRRFFAVPAVLLLALGSPLIDSVRFQFVYDFVFVSDWWCAITLLLMIGCMLQHLETGPRGFRRWRIAGRGAGKSLDTNAEYEKHGNGSIRVDVWSLVRLLIALLMANVFLSLWSINQFSPNRFRLDPSVYRVVVIAWLLALAIGVPATLLSMVRWRWLSAAQSELYLRRIYADESDAEHRLLERARLKFDQPR